MRSLIIAALLAGSLAACGGNEVKTSDSAPSTTDTASVAPGPWLPLADYHADVRRDVPELADVSDAKLDGIGRALCDVLKEGDQSSWVRAVATIRKSGISARHAGGLIVYAVGTFCPLKSSALPG